MELSKLLKGVSVLSIFKNDMTQFKQNCKIEVKSLTISHNKVKPKSLYFALKGTSFNGENFIIDAEKNGACVIVSEKFVSLKTSAFLIIVQNARIAMAQIAANFYNRAHEKLKIIGVSGTNGKSSTTYIIKHLLDGLYHQNLAPKSSLIGTNAVFIGKERLPASLTTPDPILLHELFYKMVQKKCKIVVMEISAHSVFYEKIYGIHFEALCLTNVKTDHLDFFKTQQNYISQKENLFLKHSSNLVVLNLNDNLGKALYNKLHLQKTTFAYAKYKKNKAVSKNIISYKPINLSLNGSEFNIFDGSKKYKAKTTLIGEINLQNICLALCVLKHMKFKIKDIIPLLNSLEIEGRLNIFEYSNSVRFILDYAHTYSSTKQILTIIKKLSNRKIITVLGAPGNRDEFKRKQSARISSNFGEVILTSDNPKYENPFKIMEEMKKGDKNATIIENRENAIKYALFTALNKNKKTNIVVLGKGIENYQDYNNKHLFYSDKDIILSLINPSIKS